jgi:sulfane dehydrogenase subunit SoxC
MSRVPLDPSEPVLRHPLQPHQLAERLTRVEDVIVLCHFGVPRLDPASWSLTIDGLVRRPLRLSLSDLMKRPRVELDAVHECCGSPFKPEVPTRRVCNVSWSGVRLSELLADCEPDPAARFIWSTGADYGVFGGIACDAFVKDLPIERAAADVIIAYRMNGAPLRPENGYPARLVVPGYYGTNSVKWLERLTVADARATGPFTTRWYNDVIRDASGEPIGATRPVWSIAPGSVIVAPSPDEAVNAGGPVEIWGWTWADGGVAAVDVSTDGGSNWMRANVEPPLSRSWQRFSLTWRAEQRGNRHELCARAHSAAGSSQPLKGARNEIHRVPITIN